LSKKSSSVLCVVRGGMVVMGNTGQGISIAEKRFQKLKVGARQFKNRHRWQCGKKKVLRMANCMGLTRGGKGQRDIKK